MSELREEASGLIRDFELSVLRDCLSGDARERLIDTLAAAIEVDLARCEYNEAMRRGDVDGATNGAQRWGAANESLHTALVAIGARDE